MTSSALPDFEHTVQLSQGNLDLAELAECHGVLCGLLCCQSDSTSDDYIQLLSALQLLPVAGTGLTSSLIEVFYSTRLQLDDEEMGFRLWLPDDDQPMEERTIALAHWCTGFLAGLGTNKQFENLPEEADEALKDLTEIARACISGQVDETGPESDDDEERALMEIVEYVRVVVLMLHEEFRGPDPHDAIH